MTQQTTFKIKYASGLKAAWLPVGMDYKSFPDVTTVEEIPVVVATEGYSLWVHGEELGPFAVQKFDIGEYTERPIPPEEPEEGESEVVTDERTYS